MARPADSTGPRPFGRGVRACAALTKLAQPCLRPSRAMEATMIRRTLWTASFAALVVIGTANWPGRIVTSTNAAATLSGSRPDAAHHAPGARLREAGRQIFRYDTFG